MAEATYQETTPFPGTGLQNQGWLQEMSALRHDGKTIIQSINIVLCRARISEHFEVSINFSPHPWRKSISQYNQVWGAEEMKAQENPQILMSL